MNLVDSHCHLQFEKLYDDLDGVLSRAKKADVNKMMCVGTTLADSQQSIEIAAGHDNIWAAVGVHPHDSKAFSEADIEKLKELMTRPKVVAVGEIGLDYFKNYSPPVIQQECLKLFMEAAVPSKLPFIFHVRDAFDDFWPIFDSFSNHGVHGVIHSFSAGRAELDEILKRNLYVGLNGIMTFSKNSEQLAAAKAVPLDRLILETDAPFLAPAGYRGQICEPKHIRDIAEFLAELRGESLEELAAATTKNAEKLFNI